MAIMSPSVRELLSAHEKALHERLRALRNEIIPLERELAEVRLAYQALNSVDFGPQQQLMVFDANLDESLGSIRHEGSASPYRQLTIKQLVKKALSEQFARGATASELLEFFSKAWGRRDVVRTSLSPQLSRLKSDGEIILRGQKWSLPVPRESASDERADLGKAATDR